MSGQVNFSVQDQLISPLLPPEGGKMRVKKMVYKVIHSVVSARWVFPWSCFHLVSLSLKGLSLIVSISLLRGSTSWPLSRLTSHYLLHISFHTRKYTSRMHLPSSNIQICLLLQLFTMTQLPALLCWYTDKLLFRIHIQLFLPMCSRSSHIIESQLCTRHHSRLMETQPLTSAPHTAYFLV